MALTQEWKKSSRSNDGGGQCVEVRRAGDPVEVRDTKDRSGPTLTFGPTAWQAFVGYAKQA